MIAAAVVVLIVVLVVVGVWSHRQHMKIHASAKGREEGQQDEETPPSNTGIENEAKFIPAKVSKPKDSEPEQDSNIMFMQSVTEDEREDEEDPGAREEEGEEETPKKKKKGKKKKKAAVEQIEETEVE